LPVGGGGGAGGGAGGAQHAEIPSVAAAKATKVKYLTIVIRTVYTSLEALSKPIRPSFQMFLANVLRISKPRWDQRRLGETASLPRDRNVVKGAGHGPRAMISISRFGF
jgi:hypothetical protein